jgi:hypothetical protein
MSKPDWRDAPKWAQWVAQDEDRSWTWFEHKPEIENSYWSSESSKEGRSKLASLGAGWELSLESRPAEDPETTIEVLRNDLNTALGMLADWCSHTTSSGACSRTVSVSWCSPCWSTKTQSCSCHPPLMMMWIADFVLNRLSFLFVSMRTEI